MIKTIGLIIGSLFAPNNIPESDMVRYEVATHMRKMIGLPFQYRYSLSPEQLQATPKTFCQLLLCDYQRELANKLATYSIEFETLPQRVQFHKKKIIEKVHGRRLLESEKTARHPVKQAVRALAHKWKIKHPIRVINQGGSWHSWQCSGLGGIY